MALRAFHTINVNDWDINKIQDNVAQTFDILLTKEILDGFLLKDVSLVAGKDNQINHGLKRVANWFVVRKNADVSPYEKVTSVTNDYFVLNVASNVTVSLWIF